MNRDLALSPQSSAMVVGFGRIMMGLCFFVFGIEKLWAVGATTQFIATRLPFAPAVFWLAVFIEAGFGALLTVGLGTRRLAAFFAFYCVFLAIVYHTGLLALFGHTYGTAPQTAVLARPIGDHFYSNMMIAGGFLCLLVAGPGAMALDNRLGKPV